MRIAINFEIVDALIKITAVGLIVALFSWGVDWLCCKLYGWKRGAPKDKAAQEEEPME